MQGWVILAAREWPNELVGVFGGLIAEELKVDFAEWVRDFGRHFTACFAPEYYKAYYRPGWRLRDFLDHIPKVYSVATEGFDRGAQGGVDVQWIEEGCIRYTYETQPGLISFLVGLIEGAAEFYREPVEAAVIDEKTVEAVIGD